MGPGMVVVVVVEVSREVVEGAFETEVDTGPCMPPGAAWDDGRFDVATAAADEEGPGAAATEMPSTPGSVLVVGLPSASAAGTHIGPSGSNTEKYQNRLL